MNRVATSMETTIDGKQASSRNRGHRGDITKYQSLAIALGVSSCAPVRTVSDAVEYQAAADVNAAKAGDASSMDASAAEVTNEAAADMLGAQIVADEVEKEAKSDAVLEDSK